jgi:hypothetical protein
MSGRSPSRHTKQSEVAEHLTQELSLLGTQRAAAIADCDFAKARAIDCHLDRLREEIAFTKSTSRKIQVELDLNLKKEEIRLQAATALQETRDQTFAIQKDFQERLIELHHIHSEELVTFAQEYATALELESTRAVPDAVFLKRQAQFNAKHRNYATAEALFEESNQARVDQTERRQNDLKAVFVSRRQRIIARQEGEVALCLEKQHRALEIVDSNFTKRILVLKNSLTKTAADLDRPLTADDFALFDEFVLAPKEESPQKSRALGSRPATPASTSRASGPTSSRSGTPRKSPKVTHF